MTPSAAEIADPSLAPAGEERIAWAAGQMPVLARIRERFAADRPLEGLHVAACRHVTAETANLVRALRAGGAEVALCAANPLSTQDDVAAALVRADDAEVRARRGEDMDAYVAHVRALLEGSIGRDTITLDDGADLIAPAHVRPADRPEAPWSLIGGVEERTRGLLRLRRLHQEGV